MRTIDALLTSPMVHWIGWALLNSLWQSAAMAVVLAVMLRRLRRAPAEARYLAACVALVMMVTLPAATSSHLSPAPDPVVAVGSITPARRPGPIGGLTDEVVTMGPRSSPRPAWLPPSARPQALLCGLVAAWLVGVAALTLRLLGGWLLVCRLTRRVRPLAGPSDEALCRLARALRVRRAVRLLESSLVRVPMVIGGLRPVIILPIAALMGLAPEQLEALLAHELAHIRRHDYLVNLAQSAIEVLLFYHPAAWWASRVIRVEREHCCDDLAVRACGDRQTYARALAAMEGLRSRRLSLSPAADDGPLLSRIQRILYPEVEPMNSLPVVSLGAALLIGTALLVVTAPAQPPGVAAILPPGQSGEGTERRAAPARDPSNRTVYVPVFRSPSFQRNVRLMITEAIIKEIESRTKYKVVGSPEQAGMILEGTIDFVEKDLVVEDPLHLTRPLSARVQAKVSRIDNPPLESELDAPPVAFEETIDFDPEAGETSQVAFLETFSKLAEKFVQTMKRPNPPPPPDGPGTGTKPGVAAGNENHDQAPDPNNDQEPERTFAIGDYYQRTGKIPSAEYYFGRIRRLWPESPWAAAAKSRLNVLAEFPCLTMTLPGRDGPPPPDRETVPHLEPSNPAGSLPKVPGPRRVTRIFPRDGGPDYSITVLPKVDDVSILVIRGGVEIVSETGQHCLIDVSADSAIILRTNDPKASGDVAVGPKGESIEDAGQPMEVFLEGNIVFHQDRRTGAGDGDRSTFHAKRAYYNFRADRFVGLED